MKSTFISLAVSHPHLIGEWHPVKNQPLTPDQFSAHSRNKVWWKCPVASDHEWPAAIYSRAAGNGCSVCRGLIVVHSNWLQTVYPELAAQWHPTRNSVSPEQVYARSTKEYWWRCPVAEDHEWAAKIVNRVGSGVKKPTGCPFCNPGSRKRISLSNCLATTHRRLLAEWHPTKNGSVTPYGVTSGSDTLVWWKCPVANDHEWQASISNRAINQRGKGTGCPYCTGSNKKAVRRH